MSDPDSVSRRDFLLLCSSFAASLTACRGMTTRTRVASSFLIDPALDDYRPALDALIETILPIHSPDFPLDVQKVSRRLLRMFPLEKETRFLGLQRTIVYFNQLDLSPHVAAPLISAERLALDVPERLSEREFRRHVTEKTRIETQKGKQHWERYSSPEQTFTSLSPEGRLAWWRLWSGSEFTVKREFARGVRALIMVAAYSADALWPVIGYAGPLIKKPEIGS